MLPRFLPLAPSFIVGILNVFNLLCLQFTYRRYSCRIGHKYHVHVVELSELQFLVSSLLPFMVVLYMIMIITCYNFIITYPYCCHGNTLQAPDARRAFPCWDEPAHKTTFDVTIVAPKDRVVLSNMVR